jgi:hypothetical protein
VTRHRGCGPALLLVTAGLVSGAWACEAFKEGFREGLKRSGAKDDQVAAGEGDGARTTAAGVPGTALLLRRQTEPKEGAFTVLVPEGWLTEGGVLRIDPSKGPTNSVGAKIDYTVKRDAAGTAMLRWHPNITYKDPKYLMGGFPIGSNYMGCPVQRLVSAETFLQQYIFRKQRRDAQNVQVVERKPVPGLAQRYQQRAAAAKGLAGYRYDAAALTLEYDEGGVHYREKLVGMIEDTGKAGLGMWTNRETVAVRAPAAEFDRVARLLAVAETSIKGNPAWVSGENRGSAQRARNALNTQRYLQDRLKEIVDHRRQTYAEIRHSHWLSLTAQEDYVNPHTGEVENGSNEWRHRWVNGSGDVIYTDDPGYDPTRDPRIGRSDFKPSQVRAR